LDEAPHRLIDILDPSQAYSAARFREDALAAMAEITAAGKVPLLVGGTMLYFRALEFGLDPLPQADPKLRRAIEAEAEQVGWETLHRQLTEVDPQSAARIHPNDPQRLQRALEVHRLTGRPLSAFHGAGQTSTLPYRLLRLALMPADRAALRARIARRFEQMLELGLIPEVETLHRRKDLSPSLPAIRAVGYRQVWAHLEGQLDHQAMVRKAVTATGQLAKRQMTWLRSYPQVETLEMEGLDVQRIVGRVHAHIQGVMQ
ncbi:MAG TPA: tRNA (adenosine(37)-N6)-dimethylallyltransferase MiaA, partial [Thioalkalivibrio sp.]|nr:tRNA (adenosine(37)-N6)-dimethylallyltransferase MiaA [Thioalkalivibrio sp.]